MERSTKETRICVDLDLDALRPLRQERLARLRPDLYGRYLPSLYDGASPRALQESER